MENIIRAAVQRGASDLHIKAGDVVRARINGELVPLTKQPLKPEQTRGIALRLITREEDRDRIDDLTDFDGSWGLAGVGRFRVNILRQRGSLMIVLRVIPFDVPTLEELGLPEVLQKVAAYERGLVLVTGITGSGKSTTQAAMIAEMNRTMRRHVVTLENPVEFLHRDNQCSITQRDVGTDTESFRVGLRAALRQDPDVILVGEMRDTETIDTAIKAAETGHLVISTLHTADAPATISRLISVFPPSEQEMIRIRLAETLKAVISQRLLPRQSASGRVPAAEVMIVTPTIADCILDPERVGEVRDHMAEGREQYGMQTFDQSLADLVDRGEVSFEMARVAATSPSDFELRMTMFRGA
jgi:twitching motility protein PilT